MLKLRAIRFLALAALVGCVGIPTLAQAQTRKDPPASREQRTEAPGDRILQRIKQSLEDVKLSPEQQTKIDSLLDKARQDAMDMIEELRQSDPQARRERLRQFLTDLHDQVKGVLNEEQAAEFERKVEQLRERIRGALQGAGATSRPAAGIGMAFQRLRDALGQLDLSEDQKQQVKQLVTDTGQKLQELRDQAQGDAQALRGKFQGIMRELRQQLQSVLTPEQQDKLRELMRASERQRPQAGPGDGPAPTSRPAARPGAGAAAPPGDPGGGPPVGHAAPDFGLRKLDGSTVQLSSFRGKLVLLVFASYSSPSFRQRVPGLEQLKRDYGQHIYPLIIYTRENYPTGEWEVARNKDEGIAIEQPRNIDERIAQARRAREALKLSVPILVDSMDDKTARDYDGLTNAAVFLGRDGRILLRQKWFDPYGLRGPIEQAIK